MYKTLDERLMDLVVELCEKNNMMFSNQVYSEVTNGVSLGYSPNKTWDNAVIEIETRISKLKKEVA